MIKHFRIGSAMALAGMVGLWGLVGLGGVANAALIFQSEFPSYTVSTDGLVTANVKVYLAQTGGTTTLSAEGGLNSVGFEVVAVNPPPVPPTLSAIQGNSSFSGSIVPNTAAGTLYEEMSNLTSGVTVDDQGRVFLGTFTYTGSAFAQSTVFTIRDRSSFTEIFTVSGTSSLDALTTAGQFTINVPEPASAIAVLILAGSINLLARRRVAKRDRIDA